MFTGIIETLGTVIDRERSGGNLTLRIESDISKDLKVDQSVAHNGVCLTVESCDSRSHQVTAIAETLQKSQLDTLQVGDQVNLERCLRLGDRLDGHIVQGHVDTVGQLLQLQEESGSYRLTISLPSAYAELMVDKGSITVNGISLTAIAPTIDQFEVAIIPYTWLHTTLKHLKVGDAVNLEFDILGKYVLRRNDLAERLTAKE